MYCEQCGSLLEDDALFCSDCGAQQSPDAPIRTDGPPEAPSVRTLTAPADARATAVATANLNDDAGAHASGAGPGWRRFIAETLITAILLDVWLSQQWQFWLVAVAPLLVGLVFPLVRSQKATKLTETLELRFASYQPRTQSQTRKFTRYCVRPLLRGRAAIWAATRRITDPHWQTGIRIMALAYFAILMVGVVVIVTCVSLVVVLVSSLIKKRGFDKSSIRVSEGS